MICLDSTFIIDYLRGKEEALEKAAEYDEGELVTTTINCFEALSGIISSNADSREPDSFAGFIASIQVLDLDYRAAYEGARIFSGLAGLGKQVGAADCMVAGAMLSNGCRKILTRNKKHFERIKGIEVETY